MFDFVPAQECCHHYEVGYQQRPVNGEVEIVEHTEECAYHGGVGKLLPQIHFIQFPLKALELIVFAHGQYELLVRIELLIVRVFQWGQIQHDLVQIEETQQVGYHCIPLGQVDSQHVGKEESHEESPTVSAVD